MAITSDSFVHDYIERLKQDGVDFPTIEVGSDLLDTEEMTKEKLDLLALSLGLHLPVDIVLGASGTLSPNHTIATIAGNISLPSPADALGVRILLIPTSSSAMVITAIDGTPNLSVRDPMGLVSDGSSWRMTTPYVRVGSGSVNAASSTSISVSPPMKSSSYFVGIEMSGNPNAGYWVDGKTPSGFTLNFSASTTVSFRWSARH